MKLLAAASSIMACLVIAWPAAAEQFEMEANPYTIAPSAVEQLDILGLKLRTPHKMAVAALEKEFGARIVPTTTNGRWTRGQAPIQVVIEIPIFFANTLLQLLGNPRQMISVSSLPMLTTNPIYAIERHLTYSAGEVLGPNAEELIKSIVAKYGRPSIQSVTHPDRDETVMLWRFSNGVQQVVPESDGQPRTIDASKTNCDRDAGCDASLVVAVFSENGRVTDLILRMTDLELRSIGDKALLEQVDRVSVPMIDAVKAEIEKRRAPAPKL